MVALNFFESSEGALDCAFTTLQMKKVVNKNVMGLTQQLGDFIREWI